MIFDKACMNYPEILLLIESITGNIVGANKAAEKTYGYSIAKLETMNIKEINKFKDSQIKAEMELAKKQRRNYFHFSHLTASGKIIEVEVKSLPTVIDGKPFLLSEIFRCDENNYANKIAMRHVEEEKNPVVVLDQDFRILKSNLKFEKTFGKKRDELYGINLRDFIFGNDEKFKILYQQLFEDKRANEQIKVKEKNGSLRYFSVWGIPTYSRKIFFGVVLFFKEIEKERYDYILKLKKEKELKNTELARNEIRNNYLAKMSHEMRTPMNAIVNYAEFGVEEVENPEILKYFKQIKSSSLYLMKLLDNILNINKLNSETVELVENEVFLNEIIQEILGMVEIKALEKNIKLIVDIENNKDVFFICDKVRLMEILINIINNALKYTPIAGKIIWKIRTKVLDGKVLFLSSVKDNGIGIDEKAQEKIFDPFFQEKNTLGDPEAGSGLGLAITKSLVTSMNGKIYLKSEIGVGSEFKIEFSFTNIEDKKTTKKEKNIIVTKDKCFIRGKKILVCEDNSINAKIIEKILKDECAICDIVTNGLLGVEKLKNNDYDAVLMDIRMPIMDGLVATKKIRQFNTKIPIISISANAYEQDIKKSLEAGIDIHLSKPVDKKAIIKALKYLTK